MEASRKQRQTDSLLFNQKPTVITHTTIKNITRKKKGIAGFFGGKETVQLPVVTKEHLELVVTKPTSPVSFALRNDAEDKERIMRALKQTNGNRSAAAELLGISRSALYSKLEEYELKYKFRQS